LFVRSWICAAALAMAISPAVAQDATPVPAPRRPVPDMPTIAKALGVECSYCHAGQRGSAPPAGLSGKPRMAIAREMIDMTAELNTRVPSVVGKEATATARVECITCHRGVAIPRQLTDIMMEAVVRQGPEAAVATYRDLRTRYYGGQSYDFSEDALLAMAERLSQTRPAAAIALANLNLELNPRSARSYLIRGIAQSRTLATVDLAIASFKQALEIEPENGIVQGWIYQTEQLLRRR
jgi:hypothetical protein